MKTRCIASVLFTVVSVCLCSCDDGKGRGSDGDTDAADPPQDDADDDGERPDADVPVEDLPPPPCGDGACEETESCATCPEDCGGDCLSVWVTDSLARVAPTEPPAGSAAAVLKAARNEFEAFHLIVAAPEETSYDEVDAAASDLAGPATISSDNIRFYREHYVTIVDASYQSPYPPATWPDAMVPFVNPETGVRLPGDRFEAAPFSVPAGSNQPLYVEVYVPQDTPPGVFTGTITLTASGLGLTRVPLTLTVWDITLPVTPSLQSNFGGMGDVANQPLYKQMLMTHRIAPAYPDGATPSCREDGSIDSTDEAVVLADAIARGLSSYQLPFWEDWPYDDPLGTDRDMVVLCLRNLEAFVRDLDFAGRSHLYVVDEPNSADRYQAVRDYFAVTEEADPEIRLLVTEQPWTQDEAWGTLNGSVDIWVPLFEFLDDPRIAETLAAGDEIWSYTALVQGDVALPHWQIDFPLANFRATPWLNALSHLTGILYWTTTHWSRTGTDVWVNPDTYQEDTSWDGTLHYNGEGSLFYPGDAVGYEGPVASLRLKALRDGMEDYEYVELLRQAGMTSDADTVIGIVARSWTDFSAAYADYAAAREQAASVLEGL
jgi:hypothetical protein